MKTEIKNAKFLLDGEELKLKACGLNTVASYMPWNLHERKKGEFDFSGILDVKEFIAMADELGLKFILRPGPYICSEWEFGGFPAWLLADKNVRLRCSEPHYMAYVKRYYEAVFEQVKEFYSRNIILFQIENGYASYGNDQNYYHDQLQWVKDSGYDSVVIAADGDSDTRISTTVPDGVWKTLMCGRESPVPQLELYKKHQPDMPQLIIEYWNGQGLHAGRPVFSRDPEQIARNLEKALAWGAHVNLYMFHGGTNFGFMNGAMKSMGGHYCQLSSSYDVFAPLSESGDITELYRHTRKVLAKYNDKFDENATPIPENSKKIAYGKVELNEVAFLSENFDNLSVKSIEFPCPLTMEEAGGDYGYVRYSTELAPQNFLLPISLYQYQDRGWAFFNGKKVAAFGRDGAQFSVDAAQGGTLEIVVENSGRTNFYCNIEDNQKGINGGVLLNNQQFQHGWKTSLMPMEDISKLQYHSQSEDEVCGPAFFRGSFQAQELADTFLAVTTGRSGFVKVNGFNLGRYDKFGPVYTLFVPKTVLKIGENVIEVFETEQLDSPTVRLLDHPISIPSSSFGC